MVVAGILITNGRIAEPHWSGYVLIVVGLVDIFLLPAVLIRRWRTPR